MSQSVRSAVLARRPVDAHERAAVVSFERLFDALDRPFSEQANKVHVTASAIVLTDDHRRVLLHKHKRLGLWLQPGGHIDEGELPWQAALRETVEETGLPAYLRGEFGDEGPPLVHVDVHPGPRGHTHLDLRYLLHSDPVDPSPPIGESQDVRWFAWPDAIALAEEGLNGILRSLQPGEPVIRLGVAADARAAASAFLRSRRFTTPTIPELHDLDDVTGWINGRITVDEVWVADVDGVVVAEMILGATPKDGPAAGLRWLDHLYLDPAWLGRGLGDRMFALAQQRSTTGLQLWTHEVNTRGRRFYDRHGLQVAESTDGSTNEERMPDLRYVWRP